ncbi:hypothetical protein N7530_010307 [Penicillium desertorum]|uniref:DUF6536 domain-containing protein n=1 Tax=Penicillium desertorum TaxID=1303715 RepID=A0A9W9WK74_9EURO|nr:hypothetical protein N7530_010307 [Penicillium desertorum]
MATMEIPLISRDASETQSNGEEIWRESTAKKRSDFKSYTLTAWRFTVTSGVLAGTVILLVNIITLAVIYGQHDSINYSIPFYTGPCRTAKGITIGSHLVINVLSTILLAYSNFSMQCLASPTRKEVDAAHKKHHWLSIGTPSIRNVFFVSRIKAALWLLLGVSSFPLHLIWNSTVFETKVSYDYLAISVTENFLQGADWTIPRSYDLDKAFSQNEVPRMKDWTTNDINHALYALQNETRAGNLTKLEVKECIEKYHTEFLSDRRHVLLVSDNSTSSDSLESRPATENSSVGTIYYAANPTGGGDSDASDISLYDWMCDSESGSQAPGQRCPLSTFNYSSWFPSYWSGQEEIGGGQFGWSTNGPIRYCYSETMPERCNVSIIPMFLMIVIICNVIKIVCFAVALYIAKASDHQPLCTTGDAIQSFLQHPDHYTQGRCLAAKDDYEKWLPRSREWIYRPVTVGDVRTGGQYRWRKAANEWQWMLFLLIAAILVAFVIAGSATAGTIDKRYISSAKLTEMTKSYSGNRINEHSMNVLHGFLIGNTPQLVVSYVYLALNNLMSTMLAMAEWCKYATGGQKGLRVSSPVSNTAQRSTYFLSVPFKWAIPLTVALTILHWLVSQFIFFAKIDIYYLMPGLATKIHPLGYLYQSPLAGVLAGSVGGALLIALILAALVAKYPANIPLSGCCSASIAAACHPSRVLLGDGTPVRQFEPNLSHRKLKWGVVEKPDEGADGIGHGTFAADEVSALIEGELYA